MDWHCWTCGEITKTTVDTDRPRCCRGASFTPMFPMEEPNEQQFCPDGKTEAVILSMLVQYKGQVGLRHPAQGHPEIPTVISWIPPEVYCGFRVAVRKLEEQAAQQRQALGLEPVRKKDPEEIIHDLLEHIAALDTRHGWSGAVRAYRDATGLSLKAASLYVSSKVYAVERRVLPNPDLSLSPCDIPGWQEWVVARACAAEEFDYAQTPEEDTYCRHVQNALIQALPAWIRLPDASPARDRTQGYIQNRVWTFKQRADSGESLHLRIMLPPYAQWLVMLHDKTQGWVAHVRALELQAALATCLSRRPSVDAVSKNE